MRKDIKSWRYKTALLEMNGLFFPFLPQTNGRPKCSNRLIFHQYDSKKRNKSIMCMIFSFYTDSSQLPTKGTAARSR